MRPYLFTAERVACIREEHANGTPRKTILLFVNELPGDPVDQKQLRTKMVQIGLILVPAKPEPAPVILVQQPQAMPASKPIYGGFSMLGGRVR